MTLDEIKGMYTITVESDGKEELWTFGLNSKPALFNTRKDARWYFNQIDKYKTKPSKKCKIRLATDTELLEALGL